MTILSGDIKLLASKVMDDVPNGGGGPTGNVIPDGASNAVFGDVTERQRTGGGVSIRQLHLAVQTPNTAAYMDPSIIVSQLPNDANVSITLAKCGMFAQRTEIANAIENYLIQGPEWGGYLLENHVAGQRSIQLFQRPGTPTPPIGRTLVLVASEGLPGEFRQYVRVTRVEVEQRAFTYSVSGGYVDYTADVVICDLTDALRSNFPGSAPDRGYVRGPTKTVVRDTTVADASVFYGASPLTAVAAVGDSTLRVASVYTQLVPSARTEVVALDQKPGAQRSIVLTESPRRVEVGVTPHTQRIKIGQENRGLNFVFMLKPLPAPGTIAVSFMVLGNWYTAQDDGVGAFSGSAAGQVIYNTGSMAITLPALPDAGSAIIVSYGERVGYTDRSSQGAAVRPPEFSFVLEDPGVVAGTFVATWTSGGVTKTATDDGNGNITGDATGIIDYPSDTVLLRPTAMLDAGGQIAIDYATDTVVTEIIAPGAAPDAGGFVSFTLTNQPAAKSLAVTWATARTTSSTSGAQDSAAGAGKSYGSTTTPVVTLPTVGMGYEPGAGTGISGVNWRRSD